MIGRSCRALRHFHSSTISRHAKQEVVILSFGRTPIGSFGGSLATLTATQLGTHAAKHAIKQAGVSGSDINEVYLGNVVSANVGQAPATQAAVRAGVPYSVPSTTINKVCSSGMKSVMLAAMSIQLGINNCVLAGGMESMSNAPYYLSRARTAYGLGHQEVVDACIKDGLWDAFDNHHMGMCAESCAQEHKIGREEQDKYAIESYRRAAQAAKSGTFAWEIAPLTVHSKKGETVISDDEEVAKLVINKVPTLKPAFKPQGGTVTAANSSKLNDGAAALIIASASWAKQMGLKPIARILGFGDAQQKPIDFPTAPTLAIPKALSHAGIKQSQVDYYEINEAFSVVSLANIKLLGLNSDRVNVFGGAVSLGHPVGMSGARIIGTLINVLRNRDGQIGVAAICNGGGGASAIVVEKL